MEGSFVGLDVSTGVGRKKKVLVGHRLPMLLDMAPDKFEHLGALRCILRPPTVLSF